MFQCEPAYVSPLVGIGADWVEQFKLYGQSPSVVLDFENGRYYDGVSNVAAMSSMVGGSPTITPGSGLLCNATNITGIGALLAALQGSNVTLYCETIGGSHSTSGKGIVCFNGSGLSAWMQLNDGAGAVQSGFLFNGSTLATIGTVNWAGTVRGAVAWATSGGTSGRLCANFVQSDGNTFRQDGGSGTGITGITSCQLGSYAGGFTFDGYIKKIIVYPIKASNQYIQFLATGFALPTFRNALGLSCPNGAGGSALTYLQIGNGTAASHPNIDYNLSSNPASVFCRYKTNTVPTSSYQVIFTNVGSAQPWYGYELWIQQGDAANGHAVVGCRIMGNWDGVFGHTGHMDLYGTTSICDGNYHVIGFTTDGSGTVAGTKLWVDGVQESIQLSHDNLGGGDTHAIGANTNFMISGQTGSGPGDSQTFPMAGILDWIQISRTDRSAWAATTGANTPCPSPDGNTDLSYDMTDGLGTAVTDGSANNYSGILYEVNGTGVLGQIAEHVWDYGLFAAI